MTLFEERLTEMHNQDKIIYYDYLLYKRAVGWWTIWNNDDWHRPTKIKRARYKSEFLQKIPNYYFLGIPVKELIKSTLSNGYCHACAVALSLCFDDFSIITCNLKNYAEHCISKSGDSLDDYEKLPEFEHTFLVIDIENKKTVIDTSFGFITDLETYNYIFQIDNVRMLSSKELKNTEIYKFIENRKLLEGPTYEDDLKETEAYQKYSKEIHKYMETCKNYKNNNDTHLEDFFSRCLYRTSNNYCLWSWRTGLHFKHCNHRYKYPTHDMFSLEDDEFDENLYSEKEKTIQQNKEVLENYHKKESKQNIFKTKVLKLARVFGVKKN